MKTLSTALLVSASTAALLLTAGSPAMAQAITWAGIVSDYNTGANWTGGTAPTAAGQSAIFAGTGQTTITLSAPVAPDSWTFSNPSQNYSITGGTATLSGGITDNALGKSITIGTIIAGAGSVTQSDSTGTLTLTGANTYTGSTNVQGGTLALSGAGSVAGAVSANATFDISGITAAGTTVTQLFGIGTVALGAKSLTVTGNSSISGVIQDGGIAGGTGGRLILNAPGTNLVLGGTNTYTGGTTITAGFLQVGNSGTGGSIVGDVTNNGNLAFSRSDAVTFAGVISGTGDVSKNSGGTLTLTGASTYTGATTIGGGTLALSGAGSIAGSSSVFVLTTLDISGTTTGASVKSLTGSTAGIIALGSKALTVTAGTGASLFGVIQDGGLGGSVTLAAGTQFLAGANTYTGGTTINPGAILSLGSGGTTGSVVGAIVDNGTLNFNRTDSVVSANVISGTGVVIKQGGNMLTLVGANTYTGGTTVSTGTLQIGAGGTTGSILGNVTDNAALSFNRSDAATFAGVISGIGIVNQVGTGTLTLTGVNTYIGATNISTAATLALAGAGSVAASSSVNISNAAGVFDISGTATGATVKGLTGSGSIAAGARALTFSPGALSSTFAGVIKDGGIAGGTGASLVVNAGTNAAGLVLTGANTFTGTTTVNSGAFLTIGNGGTTGSVAGNIVNNGPQLAFRRSDAVTYAGVISGAGPVAQLGSGTLTLTGVNTFTGRLLVNPGTIALSGAGSVAASVLVRTFGNFDISGTTNGATIQSLELIPVAGQAFTGQVFLGNKILTLANAVSEFDGVLQDGGIVAGTGGGVTLLAGTESLGGVNTYTGPTTISGGTLALLGTGSIANSGRVTDNGTLDISAATAAVTVNQLTGTGAVALGINNLTANNAAAGTLSGVISGTGRFIKVGAGTLTLTGTSSFTGLTQITGGTLALAGSGSLASSSGINDNATFDISATTAGTTVGSLSGNGSVVLGTKTLTLANGGGFSFLGVISGTGGLTLNSGTQILGGANTYTGTTTIASGATLQIGTAGFATGTLGSGPVADNGTLAFNGTNSRTIANVISGTGAFAQAGTGTTTLTAANTYSGTTTVSAGALTVSGSIGSSAVTVANNATLAGAGTVGATTIAAGGILAPGNTAGAVGTLSVNGNLSLASTAFTNIDLTATTADRIVVTGTAALGGTLNAAFASDTYGVTQYTVISSTGALGGTFSTFNASNTPVNMIASLSYGPNSAILALANAFSPAGTSNVSNGTVTVAGNQSTAGLSSTGSGGTISLASGSSLTDNQTSNTTYSGAIVGSGALTKTGSGTLILDGNSSSFTGTTAVNGGLLEVGDAATPGATLGGTVSVGSGGTLGGHGTLTGSVTNAGGTAPGGSIGTLTVNGNFAFASGATLQQEVAANGTADKLVVGGNVSIAGNTALQVLATDPATSYARVTNYTIITAGNGVSGAFTSVTSSNAALMPVVSYGSNAVNLAVVRTDISLATLGTTPNQTGVGNAVSAAPTSALFAAVASAADAAIPAGLDSLSGEVHATLADQLLYDGRFLEDAIHARGTSEGLHLWGSENYRNTGFGAGRGAAAASGHLLGFAIGGDLPVLENLRVGVALGNSRNTLDVSARASNGRVNATWLGGYADYQLGGLGVTASITHAWDNIATGRTVTLAASRETEAADYNAGTTTISDEIRYRVDLGSTIAEPFASVSAVRLEADAFKEAGGVAALSGISRDRNVLFTDLGARFSSSWDIGGSSLLPRLSLAWEHAADTVSATQPMTFGSGTSFNVSGAPLSRDALAMQAGAGLKLDGIDIDLGYEGRTGGNAHEDGVRLRLGVTW